MVLRIIEVALALGIGMIILFLIEIEINKVKGKTKAELMAFESYKKLISAELGRTLRESDYLTMIALSERLAEKRQLERHKNER